MTGKGFAATTSKLQVGRYSQCGPCVGSFIYAYGTINLKCPQLRFLSKYIEESSNEAALKIGKNL